MPIVICGFCEYVGQGDSYTAQIQDVERHEKFCEDKIEQTEQEESQE